MRYRLLLLFLSFYTLLPAQGLELPRKSPKASTSYTIGYTRILVEYSSPAVREREIWGHVVPYGEIWRAGANEASVVEFSTDVQVEGQALAAGRYAFFLIPREEGSWTAVFNRQADQWGTREYGEDKDALRVEVEPRFAKQANEERLSYSVVGQNIENGYLLLSWEKLRLYLRIRVETMQRAGREITQALAAAEEDQKSSIYAEAADFFLWVGQLQPAMQYIDQALKLEKSSRNHWIKARTQAAMNDFEAAASSAEQAQKAGTAAKDDAFYRSNKEEMAHRLAEWKAKAGSK